MMKKFNPKKNVQNHHHCNGKSPFNKLITPKINKHTEIL